MKKSKKPTPKPTTASEMLEAYQLAKRAAPPTEVDLRALIAVSVEKLQNDADDKHLALEGQLDDIRRELRTCQRVKPRWWSRLLKCCRSRRRYLGE